MNSCLLNGYRCSSKDILIEQRTQKKKILQRYAVSSFSACSSGRYIYFSRSAIFQQKSIQTGRERNFVDKAAPFAQLFVNPAIVEATLLIG